MFKAWTCLNPFHSLYAILEKVHKLIEFKFSSSNLQDLDNIGLEAEIMY